MPTSSADAPNIRPRTFRFACDVVFFLGDFRTRGDTVRILGRQLLRAGTSIGANLEEAAAGLTKADFIAKTSIALKEARETYYWLRLFEACRLGEAVRVRRLLQEADEIVAILTVIVRRSKASSTRG